MVDTESQDMGRAEAGRAADLETSTFMLGMFMELLSALQDEVLGLLEKHQVES